MKRLLPIAAFLALLLGGCGDSRDRTEAPARPAPLEAERPAVAAEGPAATEDAPLARREDFLALAEGGVPDALRNTVEIRNYAFNRPEPPETPEVRLEIFNVLADRKVTFEIRTLFFREDGTVIDATEWEAAEAPPRGAFFYRASTFTPYAASEQVQLRLLSGGRSG